MSKKWNTCPKCKNEVDVDDACDGSEVRCLGCRTVLVVVECDGDTWRLDVQDDEEAEKLLDIEPTQLATDATEPAR